jgi:hypothetical protein
MRFMFSKRAPQVLKIQRSTWILLARFPRAGVLLLPEVRSAFWCVLVGYCQSVDMSSRGARRRAVAA